MLLFINACTRPQSRTFALAETAVQRIGGKAETLDLYDEELAPLDNTALEKRDNAIHNADFSDAMFRYARQFSDADEIVIAAPYWDLSFPSVLKCYIEAICVNGLTFRYNEKGIPEGLCKAKRLIYITTAGGYIPENDYGYNYIKQLCSDLFGITDTLCIKAEGLDIVGSDIKEIMRSAEDEINSRL